MIANNNYDYILIGAGIIGLSIAYSLSKRNKKVLLLDQSEYATKASGTNLGQISVADRDEGLEFDMVQETLKFYQDHQTEFEYASCGGLAVFQDMSDYETVNKLVEKRKNLGYEIELVHKTNINEIEPNLHAVEYAVHSKQDGVLNPFKINNWLFDECMKNNVVFHKEKVIQFKVEKNRVQIIKTPQNDYKATQIILATGSWTKELLQGLGIKVDISYVRASAMVTQPIPKIMNGHIEDGVFFINKHAEPVFFGCTQTKHGSVLIAQANETGSQYNVDVDLEKMHVCAKLFLEKFPMLKEIQVVRQWSGVTTITKDNLAYWGPTKTIENLFVAAAFKGAYSLAYSVGERTASWLIDDLVDERYQNWSPNREV